MRASEKIAELMRRRGMGLKDLAKATGIKYTTLANYVKPSLNRVPPAVAGVAIARALRAPAEWIFDETQGFPPPGLTGPPWKITPWPPDGIDWETIHVLVARHAIEQELHTARRLLNRIDRLQGAGNQAGADAASEDFRKSMDRYGAILTGAPIDVHNDGDVMKLCQQFEELPPRFFSLLRDRKHPRK